MRVGVAGLVGTLGNARWRVSAGFMAAIHLLFPRLCLPCSRIQHPDASDALLFWLLLLLRYRVERAAVCA